jgi:16S rRNA C967 or C1407 C5-methylase (RsmB/RsmF family)
VFEALSTTSEGVMALYRMMEKSEPAVTRKADAAPAADEAGLREMMRDYIQQQRESREYEAFLRAKITAARRSVESGRGHPDIDVEAEFSARRERALRSE